MLSSVVGRPRTARGARRRGRENFIVFFFLMVVVVDFCIVALSKLAQFLYVYFYNECLWVSYDLE